MKILLLVIGLLATGVGLTLLLPEYKVDSTNKKAIKYEINQDSLTTPLNMQDLLLVTPTPQDAMYALRLGLFSQLQQATKAAEALQLPALPMIVKAVGTNREWYLLTLGPYASEDQAEQKKLWLQNQQISATLILWSNSDSKPDN